MDNKERISTAQTTTFDKIEEGQPFVFGELIYIKTGKDKALSLAGSRIFNLREIVTLE